ncbi:hypothetical protein M7I_6915 [Glarea lozoyensis 74030]|uniref:Chitin-binding type-4 domain-containing protein n=1 Tax=Glarea lozoyensis (strain ATCC 74030 / MF5533) TaxID=1104152 RepID=H0EVV8_GLAL7|nr:hypothetical protein M7I_6915 [Glarea lozoyensis 74030]
MQYSSFILAAASGLITSVTAHGAISSPTPRVAGPAMAAACGQQVFNNQASDSFGNIQGELQVASSQSDYDEAACNIWQCKGYKFEDNAAANIQSWTAGQVVDFKFDVRAPHTGTANVSIVETATNSIIDNARPTSANDTAFSITVPAGLESTCGTAGACVLQHYWDARSIDQTYESCVDFTIGAGGAAPPAASSAVASSSAAPATSAVASPATSVAAPVTEVPAATSAVAVPTTLQTLTRPATTAAAPVATAAPVEEDDEDC